METTRTTDNQRFPCCCEAELPPYSVLTAVYAKDRPEWFEQAIDSVAMQSLRPQEIVVMQDGPVGEDIKRAQKACMERYPGLIRIVELPKNGGLGAALRQGVLECRNEWIARMDSDDISALDRCEKELQAALCEDVDIIGCYYAEFCESVDNVTACCTYPENHDDLVEYSRRRNPFCHAAVMMKKTAVLRAGNYVPVDGLYEDYDLFVRMLEKGARGHTINQCLYYVRANDGFYMRRGGVRYVKALLGFNVELLQKGWMRPKDFFMRSCGNIVLGLAPGRVRKWLYRRLLRE